MSEAKQCWSLTNEDFTFETLSDLLNSADVLPGQTVYVGQANHPEARQIIDAGVIIDQMRDCAWDIAGEFADDFPDVTKEAEEELNQLLWGWIEKHATISFFTVSNIQEYQVTYQDIQEAQGGGAA